ncbi:MAG: hypothetical protein H6747_10350 [Deltaproteobacteria bacterium]|nr:hypothetical protein [Deltaproteobacteria bacterium]
MGSARRRTPEIGRIPVMALLLALVGGCGLDGVGPDLEAWHAAHDDAASGGTDVSADTGDVAADAGMDADADAGDDAGTDASSDGAGDCPTDGAPCDDGDACTTASACKGGVCIGTAEVDCDDGNACTSDVCADGGTCAHTGLDGPDCDDGEPCSSGDACTKGACVGTAWDANDNDFCDDGDICTKQGCTAGKGCAYDATAADGTDCDDGSACTIADACANGACVGTSRLGALTLAKAHASILRTFVRMGGEPMGLGQRMETPLSPPAIWVVGVAADPMATQAVQLPGVSLPLGSDPHGTVRLDDGTQRVYGRVGQGSSASYLVATLGKDGTVLSAATTIASDGAEPIAFAAASSGGWLIGRRDGTDPGTDIVALSADGKSLAPVKHALSGPEIHGGAGHPRGMLLVGRSYGAVKRPFAAVVEPNGAVVVQRTLERGGAGIVERVTGSGAGHFAAGRWSAKAGATPQLRWWRLDRHGRVYAHGGLGVAAQPVALLAPQAAPDAMLILLDVAGAAARIVTVDEGARVVGDVQPLPLGVTPTAFAETDEGLLVAGMTAGPQPEFPLATLIRSDGYGAASCDAAGACYATVAAGCDDDNACTDDHCIASVGCVHDAHTAPCPDGGACLTGASCSKGACAGGAPRLYSDIVAIDKADPDLPPIAVASPDGGAVVALRGFSATGNGQADVVRFGRDGKALWSVTSQVQVTDLALAGTTLFFVRAEQNGANFQAVVERRALDSTSMGSTAIVVPGSSSTHLLALTPVSDQAVVGVGAAIGNAFSAGSWARIGADGTLQGMLAVPNPGAAASTLVDAVAVGEAGDVVAAGVDTVADKPLLSLVYLDSSGAPVWIQRHGAMSASPGAGAIQLLPAEYGRVAARLDRGSGTASLALFGAQLDLLHEGPMGVPTTSYSLAAVALPDGGWGTTGYADGELIQLALSPGGTPMASQKLALPDTIGLAAAATVLTSGDVFVAAQRKLKDGSHGGVFRRLTAEGFASCTDAGICGTTPAAACQTGLACASALCDPTLGCGKATPPGGGCFGPGCTGLGTCDAAYACTPPAADPKLCDDGSPCTADACSPLGGCSHDKAADDTSCDDGEPCTAADTCLGGQCVGQPVQSCP